MESNKRHDELECLFRRLPAALYRTSPQGEVLEANDALAELLGYGSVEEVLADRNVAISAYVDTEARARWRKTIEEQGIIYDFLSRMQRRDGQVIWVRDTARAIQDEDGGIRFYEGTLVDVTAEIRASSSSAILSDVLETSSDHVVVFDEDGLLRYANGASRAFLGIEEDFHLDRPTFDQLFAESNWAETYARGQEGGFSGEVTLTDRFGRPTPLWVVVSVHQGRDGAGYLSGIARDLTRMKRTQDRLEELVTAKDVFVATVSHELRNPLAGVVGLAEEMRDRFEDFGDDERHDLITLIAHQAAEMASLVDDLLVAARSDVGDVAVVPELIDVTAQLTELTSRMDYELSVDLPREELAAWADPQRFRQIVRNLLSNVERHGGDRVHIEARRVGSQVLVAVSDDGPGVADEDIEKIFEPYQRADGVDVKQGSVGLGLSVARRLARLMEGELEYAREGQWSIFRLRMPTGDRLRIPAS